MTTTKTTTAACPVCSNCGKEFLALGMRRDGVLVVVPAQAECMGCQWMRDGLKWMVEHAKSAVLVFKDHRACGVVEEGFDGGFVVAGSHFGFEQVLSAEDRGSEGGVIAVGGERYAAYAVITLKK